MRGANSVAGNLLWSLFAPGAAIPAVSAVAAGVVEILRRHRGRGDKAAERVEAALKEWEAILEAE